MKKILLLLNACFIFLSAGIASAKAEVQAVEYKAASFEDLSKLAQNGDFKAEMEALTIMALKPFEELMSLANSGDPLAQTYVGVKYQLGEAIEHDLLKAEEWHLKAVEQGYSFAKVNLGYLYAMGKKHIDGREIKKDTGKAMALMTEAANQGHPTALAYLANSYLFGVPPLKLDINKSLELYAKAVEKGSADAAQTLGSYYYYGTDQIPKDTEKALFWYEKALELGAVHMQSEINKIKGIEERKEPGSKPKPTVMNMTTPLEREDFLELYDMDEYLDKEKRDCERVGYSETDCICELKEEYKEMRTFMKEVLERHPEWEGSRLKFKGKRLYQGDMEAMKGQMSGLSVSTGWDVMKNKVSKFEKKMCSRD